MAGCEASNPTAVGALKQWPGQHLGKRGERIRARRGVPVRANLQWQIFVLMRVVGDFISDPGPG